MTQEEQWLLHEKYGGAESASFFEDCERLKRGEPLAYLIGSIPFLGADISLASRPLIPRNETEYWTEIVLEEIQKRGKKDARILDLCAGSGAIGVALARALPAAQVDLAEIEVQHHATIRENLARNGISPKRFRIYGGDLFAEVSGRYDYILANPPYLAEGSPEVAASVREYEPPRALYAQEKGFALIRRIIEEAPAHLRPSGHLYIEHDPHQAEQIASCAAAHGFAYRSIPDQYGAVRVSLLTIRT